MSNVESEYRARYETVLVPLANRLERHLRDHFDGWTSIDRIVARAKSADRFVAKAAALTDGKMKYREPFDQIQDQIGARIITRFLQHVDPISANIDEYFRKIETQRIEPDSDAEFGYFGRHFVLFLPTDLFDDEIPADRAPKFFELQIKTLYQHAWAEANHDLAYKPQGQLTADQKRKVAFTAAQSWGADRIFDELCTELTVDAKRT